MKERKERKKERKKRKKERKKERKKAEERNSKYRADEDANVMDESICRVPGVLLITMDKISHPISTP
jgi:hypothetical protein